MGGRGSPLRPPEARHAQKLAHRAASVLGGEASEWAPHETSGRSLIQGEASWKLRVCPCRASLRVHLHRWVIRVSQDSVGNRK